DVNGDGYQDVVIGRAAARLYRMWDPKKQTWAETPFPFEVTACRFGILGGVAVAMADSAGGPQVWVSRDGKLSKALAAGLAEKLGTFRLLDIDGGGWCELISDGRVFRWQPDMTRVGGEPAAWKQEGILPGANLSDESGGDMGYRFVDLDGDGRLDILLSN